MNTKIFSGLGKTFVVGIVTLLSVGMFGATASAIDGPANVVVTFPIGGESWSGTQNVTWTDASSASPYSIFYSSNFGAYSNLASNEPGSPYLWDTTTLSTDGTYQLKIVNSSGEEGISNTFTVDNTAPTFAITDGTEAGPVQTDTINVTVDASISGLVSSNYGFSPTNNTCSTADYTSGDADPFTSGVDFPITGDHTDYLCVKAVDNAGNVGYQQVGQLNTDNTVPTITGVVGTTIQGAWDTIEIAFDESVVATDSDWTDGNEFNLESPVGTSLVATGATYSYDSPTNVLTITLDEATPNEWLKNGDFVKIIPNATVEDLAGNTLSLSPVTSAVAVTGDVVNPNVAISYSNSGPVKNGDVVTVTATFNESIDPAVTPEISIAVPGSGNVSAVTMTGSGIVWTYNWTVGSGDGTATITIDAEDLAGNNNPVESNNTIVVDNTAPWMQSYTLDDASANTYFNSTTDNAKIDITANEPVKYTMIYICGFTDSTCDGTTATKVYNTTSYAPSVTKQWDGKNTGGSYASDGKYKIKVNIKDEAGNTSTQTLTPYNIFVDTVDPNITDFDKPVADTVYTSAPPLDFTPGDVGGLGTLACSYSLDGGTDVPVSTCTAGTATGATETISGLSDGRHTVDVKVTDQAGNTVTDGPVSFVYDTDGILTVDDSPSTNPDFPTIQEAIDAAVPGITTIDVATGSYGAINVDKPLIIKGANAGIDPNTGTIYTWSTIFSGSGNIVTIDSDDVTIDGFTITNTGLNSGVGIYSSDNSNLTIKNNIISNIGNTLDDKVGRGIEIVSSTGATADVNGVTIENNKINAITSGLRTGSNSTSASGISIGWKDGSNDITDLLIQDNVISDIDADTSPWSTTKGQGAYGILLNHGNAGGTPGAVIKDNTISDLEGLWAHGIGLEGNTPGAQITGNTISNLIDNKGGTDAIGIYAEDNPGAGSVQIHNNKLTSMAIGVALKPSTATGVMDATNNWWGDATGPKNASSNPGGLGVAVVPAVNDGFPNYVDFSPFYNSSAMDTLVSVDPIHHFDLAFSPNPQAVNNPSTLTITAKDAGGYTVVNDTSTSVNLNVISGTATLTDMSIPMEADGDTTTTITSNTVGTAGVRANDAGNPIASGDGTIEFTATPLAPIVIDDIIAVSSSAAADDTYANGWHYIYKVTINTSETDLFVKFANWLRIGGSGTVPANGNMRLLFNTATGNGLGSSVGSIPDSDIINGFGTVESYEIGNDYVDQKLGGVAQAINISGLDANTRAGRQIQFDVYTKLPLAIPAGFYETTYGIKVI